MTNTYLPRPINSTQMRSVNRSAVLDLFRRSSPIARSKIARILGLSQPTVMRIVDELVEKGMVRYTGESEGGLGRRRDLLEYYKDGHAVIGIDLGGTNMFGALANIGGEILHEITVDNHATIGDDNYRLLLEMIKELVNTPRREAQTLRGIAVGAPGVTESRTGIVRWAPSLNWRDFSLKAFLENEFHLPVIVENDVNLAALGEHWFGAGQGTQNMVLLAIGTGLGSGIIMDGVLLRGHNESAGEVGYLLSTREDLNHSYNQFGAMESIISGTGIANRARALLQGKFPSDQLSKLTSENVFDAARQNIDWAKRLIDETVDNLSLTILNLSTIIDPELIVIGGGVAKSADLLIPAVQERIAGVLPITPKVVVSQLGRRGAVMGGIAQIVLATSDYYIVRKVS